MKYFWCLSLLHGWCLTSYYHYEGLQGIDNSNYKIRLAKRYRAL
jgi:hypothetical protein